MWAARINQFGSPASLQLEDLPKPNLADSEVLVQIHAAGITPSDVKNVAGNMLNTTLPRTPGRDFAGVVVEGSEALLGQVVWGTGGRYWLYSRRHSRRIHCPPSECSFS